MLIVLSDEHVKTCTPLYLLTLLLFSLSFLVLLDYVKRFATEEALREQEHVDSSDSESSMSDFSENEAQDMEL